MTRKKSNAGGSAMSLGARFQARVSAGTVLASFFKLQLLDKTLTFLLPQ
jgi:hypothetical protein